MLTPGRRNVAVLLAATFVVVLLLILILLSGTLTDKEARVSWTETTRRKLLLYDGATVALFGDRTLEQTFTANYPGLSQIDVLFEGASGQGQEVVFLVKSQCDSVETIVSQVKEVAVTDGPAFQSFVFAPLDDSAGRSYCLVLAASGVEPGSALQFRLSNGDLYPSGRLTIRDPAAKPEDVSRSVSVSPPKSAASLPVRLFLPLVSSVSLEVTGRHEDIGFQLRYSSPISPAVRVLAARLTANKPFIWGIPWLYAGLVLVYIILLVGLFLVAMKVVYLAKD